MGFVSFRLLVLPLAALALTFAVASARPAPASADVNCSNGADATLDAEERYMLTLINNHRAANGRAPLTASYMLSKSAAWKSKDMGDNNYFAHNDLTRTWSQRIRDCGYGFGTAIGENIAAGYTTTENTFIAWKNSPGHNSNMLSTSFTAIGIGRHNSSGSIYGWQWTNTFGGYNDGWATITQPSTPAPVLTPVAPVLTPSPKPQATATPARRRPISSWWWRRG